MRAVWRYWKAAYRWYSLGATLGFPSSNVRLACEDIHMVQRWDETGSPYMEIVIRYTYQP